MISFAFAKYLIKKTFIVVTLHLLIEAEGVVWMELDFKERFEFVDDLCEEGREVRSK